MRIVKQRIHAAEISFGNVPDGLLSEFLTLEESVSESDDCGMLVRRYSFRKGLLSEKFARRLSTELQGGLGNEVARLKGLGLCPVFSVSYSGFANCLIAFGCEDLIWLASEQRGVSLLSSGGNGKSSVTSVDLPSDFIALLAAMGFTLNIGF